MSAENVIIKKFAPYSMQRFRKIIESLEKVDRSLDLGCSIGVLTSDIAEKSKFVVGFDISKPTIKAAKKISPENCSFVIGDAVYLPFKNSVFNQIVSSEVIEHIENYRKYIAEAYRVSAKNSDFILTTPNRNVNHPSIGYIPAPSLSWFLGKLTRNPLFLYPYGHYFGGFSSTKLKRELEAGGFSVEEIGYKGFVLGKIIDDLLYVISIKMKIYGDVVWFNTPNEKYLNFYKKFINVIEHIIKIDSLFVNKLGLEGYILITKARRRD